MKKATALGLTVLVTALIASCAPAGAGSGAAAAKAIIGLLPENTTGVLAIDIQRMLGTEAARKALENPATKKNMDEFTAMSGIDPAKDVSYVGFGFVGQPKGLSIDGGVIVGLKYDRAKLLAVMKAKAPEMTEEAYGGISVYGNLDGGGEAAQSTRAAFLDETHIVVGGEQAVKSIIDVRRKTAGSLAKSVSMSAILGRVDTSGLAWGAFLVPRELLGKAIASTPQLAVLEGVTALTMAFDYGMGAFTADIRAHGGTKEQNDNLAATLNGLKALGAMYAAQEPAAGEALDGIAVSAGKDYTRVAISLSEEVMDKIGKLARAKAGEFMKQKGLAGGREKKRPD